MSQTRCSEQDYRDAIAFYNEPRWQKTSLGLERIGLMMELLGRPDEKYKVVHVAGTNGKGSICSFLNSILCASGLKCGLFTSPFIERFEERIKVNGKDISAEDLVGITEKIRACAKKVETEIGEHPTEFELMCTAGLSYFAEQSCDVAICEVGLGGRLDATNVVDPAICAIARIGLDHTSVLGQTLEQIAEEKAGIIKQGVPVVSFPQEEDAMRIIEKRCSVLGCELVVSDFSHLHDNGASLFEEEGKCEMLRSFSYKGAIYETSLAANYQLGNAAVAIDTASVLSKSDLPCISQESIKRGVRLAHWPGRFEIMGKDPLFIIDGAHNPQGANALSEALEQLIEQGVADDFALICGMLVDKDVPSAIEQMLGLASIFVAYEPDNARAMSARELSGIARKIAFDKGYDVQIQEASSPSEALKCAYIEKAPRAIVAFGTLYAISQIKEAYRKFALSNLA